MSDEPNRAAPDTASTAAPEPALPPPSPPPAAASPRAAASSANWIAVAAALVAMCAAGYQWYDARNQTAALKDELARRLAEGEVRGKAAAAAVEEARVQLKAFDTRLGTLENGLAESQNQQIALEALYQQLSRNSDEWALSEIEQTLTIAAQQLQLAGNVRAAILALQNADARLQRIDRPQLAPLRKVIERDIELLRVSPFVDVVGLSLKIDNLLETVETAPLAMQQRPAEHVAAQPAEDATEAPYLRLVREIWADLRSLVRIQNIERPEPPLLDPGQAFFLRENVKLRLLSARIALIQRDAKTYRSDLLASRQWIERHYDPRDRSVAAALASLKQLAEIDVGIAVPDINASLNAVRDYKLTRDKGQR
jgi:uroporphyrin-3 C-methyltransferase